MTFSSVSVITIALRLMKLLLALLIIASLAGAQTDQTGRGLVHSDPRTQRLALVIGNDAYPDNPLHNAW